ncbi:MAG: hypothetical protein K2Q14_07345, partial [Gammaproteobacteria bacterium]|nr:hypothetical protein [Gammaproteobacteria bacterium]
MINLNHCIWLAFFGATITSFLLGYFSIQRANKLVLSGCLPSSQRNISWLDKLGQSNIFIAFTFGAAIFAIFYNNNAPLTWILFVLSSALVLLNHFNSRILSKTATFLLIASLTACILLLGFFHYQPILLNATNKPSYLLAIIFFILTVGLMSFYHFIDDMSSFSMSETIFVLLAAIIGLVYKNIYSPIFPYILTLLGACLGFLFWSLQFPQIFKKSTTSLFLGLILSFFCIFTIFCGQLSI